MQTHRSCEKAEDRVTPNDEIVGGDFEKEKFYPEARVVICSINIIIGLIISLGMARWMRGVIGYTLLIINVIGIVIASKRL